MTEHAHGPTGPGTVVLELGADIGALILYTPADLDGAEIEISQDDIPGARRTHSQVRPRHLPAGTAYAAVYPGLPAGQYTIWHDENYQAATATITGGQVTTCHWPG
jgi:quercetin dioxygenase-like cupin family protein